MPRAHKDNGTTKKTSPENRASVEIQKLLLDLNITKQEAIEATGWVPATFYSKIRRNNWCEDDIRELARALNCDYEIRLIPRDK